MLKAKDHSNKNNNNNKNNKNVMNVEKITYIIHQYFQHLPISYLANKMFIKRKQK